MRRVGEVLARRVVCRRASSSEQSSTSSDRGSMSAEMVILIPMLVLFIAVVIGLGRAVNLQGEVQAAAREGARAASFERTTDAASAAARDAVSAAMPDDREGDCQPVAVDLSNWQPGGTVTVELTCRATMSDLALPGVPGSIIQRSDASAPLDTFRGQD